MSEQETNDPMQDELKKTLGARLRGRRQQLRLTQDEVASRAGFSSKYISEIERGCRDMPLSTLCRIVEHGLEWRVDEALFGLTTQESLNPAEELISPMVQKLAVEIAALPEEQQYRVVEVMSGLLNLVNAPAPTNGSAHPISATL